MVSTRVFGTLSHRSSRCRSTTEALDTSKVFNASALLPYPLPHITSQPSFGIDTLHLKANTRRHGLQAGLFVCRLRTDVRGLRTHVRRPQTPVRWLRTTTMAYNTHRFMSIIHAHRHLNTLVGDKFACRYRYSRLISHELKSANSKCHSVSIPFLEINNCTLYAHMGIS